MHILAFGLSHKTAPVEIREALAVGQAELPGLLARLRDLSELDEVAVLSTCNRVEVYGATAMNPLAAVDAALDVLVEGRGVTRAQVEPHVYRHTGPAAVRHLLRVAAGLDSLVIGETQILGQVRTAYQEAVAAGTVGRVLHQVFHTALAFAKRAHTETALGRNPVSVAYAAVELAARLFHTLRGRPVMAIGAGEMAKLAVRHLKAAGAGEIFIANRTRERAEKLAMAVGGTPISLAELPAYLPRVDVVVSSTGAPGYVLTADLLREALRSRRGRPIFVFDIAVPRDVDPACSWLDGVYLYDIDDLKQVVTANLEERQREAEKVERLAAAEVEKFMAWLRAQEVAPAVRILREKVEAIRQRELERALARMPHLSDRDRQVVEALTVALVKKIMNPPTRTLIAMAEAGNAGPAVEWVNRLFDLDLPGADPHTPGQGRGDRGAVRSGPAELAADA